MTLHPLTAAQINWHTHMHCLLVTGIRLAAIGFCVAFWSLWL